MYSLNMSLTNYDSKREYKVEKMIIEKMIMKETVDLRTIYEYMKKYEEAGKELLKKGLTRSYIKEVKNKNEERKNVSVRL